MFYVSHEICNDRDVIWGMPTKMNAVGQKRKILLDIVKLQLIIFKSCFICYTWILSREMSKTV